MLVAIVIGIVGFFAGEGLYLLANDKTPSLDMHVWGTIGAVAAGYLGYLYDHHIRKDAN